MCTHSTLFYLGVASETYILPDEGDTHAATWMAYGATKRAWGSDGVYGRSRDIARRDLIRVAASLSRFEPVKMLIDNEEDLAQAKQFLEEMKRDTEEENVTSYKPLGQALPDIEAAGKIEFIIHHLDDLWIRDTGPVFVHDDEKTVYGVDFNFNGWGQQNTGKPGWKKDLQKIRNGIQDQPISYDQKIAKFILDETRTKSVEPVTRLVMEGGGIEVDGQGTAICTESCILNDNRNPGLTKTDVEKELYRLLGVRKVIWLPGLKAKDVTDGHIDFYARFVGEAKVVYALDQDRESPDYGPTHKNKEILSDVTDAMGRKIEAIPLLAPDFIAVKKAVEARNYWDSGRSYFNENGFAAGYVGFYATKRCILMAKFGDKRADKNAFEAIEKLYSDRFVIQITTDGLGNGGGTIHCATQQQIKTEL